jgi:hypothetical protein
MQWDVSRQSLARWCGDDRCLTDRRMTVWLAAPMARRDGAGPVLYVGRVSPPWAWSRSRSAKWSIRLDAHYRRVLKEPIRRSEQDTAGYGQDREGGGRRRWPSSRRWRTIRVTEN